MDVRAALRWFPPFTLLLFLVPLGAGLAGTVLPAFGYFPAVGGDHLTLSAWHDLLGAPGFGRSLFVTIVVGVGATAAALLLAVVFTAAWHQTLAFARLRKFVSPLLAAPHAAFAIGFAFLLMPSGWLVRFFSPWLIGADRPPDILFVQDPNGLALALALASKEVFFLLLMIWAALGQLRVDRILNVARTLGYSPLCAWMKAVFPPVYTQIRLPVYAVLAYSMSVVDMSIILGPTTPPTLPVLILQWSQDPDTAVRMQAAAGAIVLLLCVVISIALWRVGEYVTSSLAAGWLAGGVRHLADRIVRWMSGAAMIVVLFISAGSIAALAVWSVAEVWRFPSVLPTTFSLGTWQVLWPDLLRHALITATLAVASVAVAFVAVVGCLENELWNDVSPTQRSLTLLYLPLLVPQVSFLFGLQVVFVAFDIDGTWLAVVWCHLIFVLPYIFLVLSDPYRAIDVRYARAAVSLGASPFRVIRKIRLPLLAGAIAISLAVGFAVSVTQYLATLYPGAGRFPTVTTEAVILASGGDRRVAAVYGIAQMALPLFVFVAASIVSLRQSSIGGMSNRYG